MPKLLRPYIPVSVRVQVAIRQMREAAVLPETWNPNGGGHLLRQLLAELEHRLGGPLHLDHDPALENRTQIKDPVTGEHKEYDPPANDPNHLVYRTAHDHYIKTHVRGDGAQYSDTALAKRERRRTKGKRKSRPMKSANRWPPKGIRKIARKLKMRSSS